MGKVDPSIICSVPHLASQTAVFCPFSSVCVFNLSLDYVLLVDLFVFYLQSRL